MVLAIVSPLSAIEHSTTIEHHAAFLEITVTAAGADLTELFENLADGMSARVQFDIRVSEPRSRFGRLFGDRFVRQFQPGYQVRWDPYDGRYVVLSHDGARSGK